MLGASASDSKLRRRMRFYEFRVVEELYDYENDPDALENLIDEPRLNEQVRVMRAAMLARMEETNDPLLDTFEEYLRTQ